MSAACEAAGSSMTQRPASGGSLARAAIPAASIVDPQARTSAMAPAIGLTRRSTGVHDPSGRCTRWGAAAASHEVVPSGFENAWARSRRGVTRASIAYSRAVGQQLSQPGSRLVHGGTETAADGYERGGGRIRVD
jgi:hypothetical protein